MTDLNEILKGVRGKIAAACARVGRDPGEVEIIAVTKTHGAEVVNRPDAVTGERAGIPKHPRKRGRAGIHRVTDDGRAARRSQERHAGPNTGGALWPGHGHREGRRVPRRTGRLVHHGADAERERRACNVTNPARKGLNHS